MLFHTDDTAFESEKERNFYYKIFAGYFFNELIGGYSDRVEGFIHLLNIKTRLPNDHLGDVPCLDISAVRVSFDNHAYLFKKHKEHRVGELEGDRGEFADILIQDIENKIMIPVEAKLFSDWSFEKDIEQNRTRHQEIGIRNTFPVLLLKRSKWEQVQGKSKQSGSSYSSLEGYKYPPRVICWEDLLPLITNTSVRKYMKMMLSFKSQKELTMHVESDWMRRSSSKHGQ